MYPATQKKDPQTVSEIAQKLENATVDYVAFTSQYLELLKHPTCRGLMPSKSFYRTLQASIKANTKLANAVERELDRGES